MDAVDVFPLPRSITGVAQIFVYAQQGPSSHNWSYTVLDGSYGRYGPFVDDVAASMRMIECLFFHSYCISIPFAASSFYTHFGGPPSVSGGVSGGLFGA